MTAGHWPASDAALSRQQRTGPPAASHTGPAVVGMQNHFASPTWGIECPGVPKAPRPTGSGIRRGLGPRTPSGLRVWHHGRLFHTKSAAGPETAGRPAPSAASARRRRRELRSEGSPPRPLGARTRPANSGRSSSSMSWAPLSPRHANKGSSLEKRIRKPTPLT